MREGVKQGRGGASERWAMKTQRKERGERGDGRRRKETEGEGRRRKETGGKEREGGGRREVRFCRSIETGVGSVLFCGC